MDYETQAGLDMIPDHPLATSEAPLPSARGSGAVDPVNHPPHYTQHPSGVECIQVTECMNFCLGNAVKYIWRADLKNDAIEDLEKARWYVSREIERRKRQNSVLGDTTNEAKPSK